MTYLSSQPVGSFIHHNSFRHSRIQFGICGHQDASSEGRSAKTPHSPTDSSLVAAVGMEVS